MLYHSVGQIIAKSGESITPSSTVPFDTHDEQVSVMVTVQSDIDDEQTSIRVSGNHSNCTSSSVISPQTYERLTSTVNDMVRLCRLCSKNIEDTLMSIDINKSSKNNLKFEVKKLLPFIDLDDDSPKHICFDCVCIVTSFYRIWVASKEREINKKLSLSFSDMGNKLNVSQKDNERLNLLSDENYINSTFMEPFIQPLILDTDVQNTFETALSDENIEDTPKISCATVEVSNAIREYSDEIIEGMPEIVCVTENISNAIISEHSEEDEQKICLVNKFPFKNSKLKVQNCGKTRLHDVLGKIAYRVNGPEPNQEDAEEKEEDDNQDCTESNPILLDSVMRPSLGESHYRVLDHDYQLTPIVIDEHGIKQTYATRQLEKISTNLSKTTVAPHLFSCDLCSTSYASKHMLTKHETAMHPTFKCDNCPKSFSHITNLIMHRCRFYNQFRMDIGDGKYRYQCDQCPYYTSKSTYQLKYFKKHYETHSTGLEMQCEQCPEKFYTKDSMKVHMHIMHHQIKTHKCLQCGETFAEYRALRSHREVHSAGWPYKCHECGKKFLYKCRIAAHIKSVHQKERNHQCPDCNRPFPTDTKMKKHMVQHTINQKYMCELCNKGFFAKYWLTEHIKLMHRNSQSKFLCSVCGKAYMLKKSLAMHCQKVHIHDLVLPESNLLQSSLSPSTLWSVDDISY